MEPILELESARLVLRQWRTAICRSLRQMCADPQVMRYFPAPLTAWKVLR
jgi:RimJ/RimL family protein N-acetyltransferase